MKLETFIILGFPCQAISYLHEDRFEAGIEKGTINSSCKKLQARLLVNLWILPPLLRFISFSKGCTYPSSIRRCLQLRLAELSFLLPVPPRRRTGNSYHFYGEGVISSRSYWLQFASGMRPDSKYEARCCYVFLFLEKEVPSRLHVGGYSTYPRHIGEKAPVT
ncbi:hypothetical protein TWF102_009847 [Orbilia oligospora]|uniref:Uncharacterized protein n=1 Tax=Orbilia oligospora TaxID=2813651 RepID=A0A7C8N6R6_ORBOL|nr:hypothetical protein TWF102_009847 [Orbilia oligospora]KAF3104545.1 hypothetical protein TWF103_006869 [Orbilia oligospora]